MNNEVERLKSEIRRLRETIGELTPSLDHMLARRGFRIYKKEPSDDLLVPDKRYADSFYEKLHKYSFRLFLRDVIKHQDSFSLEDVTRYSTVEITSQYMDFLMYAGLAESKEKNRQRLKTLPVRSFGETLEWFIAKLIKEEFGIETVWGVKFRRPEVGGDYDLIAKFDSGILYMEIKSSPPKQIDDSEISAFLNRVEDLAPEISIFFVDTELRMKDKIVAMFDAELQVRFKKVVPIRRIAKELFHINRKIYIINSKGGISSNIEIVLSHKYYSGTNTTCNNPGKHKSHSEK